MWYKFWIKCGTAEKVEYKWYKSTPVGWQLQDDLDQWARRTSDRTWDIGIGGCEPVEVLPEEVRREKAAEYNEIRANAERMLEILGI